MSIRTVFFDLDDTLVGIKPEIYADLAQEISITSHCPVSSCELKQAIKEEWAHRNGEDISWVTTPEQESEYWQTFYHEVLKRLDVNAPPQHLVNLLAQKAADPASFICFSDVISTLMALKKIGIKLGMISNAFPSARSILNCFCLIHWFDPLVLSYKYPWAKPERGIYKYALKEAGVSPAEALFVDDRPQFLSGAKEAGMKVLLINREHNCQPTRDTICGLGELLITLEK
jgi:HAD superfamily hydrolase (TIGR01509 family)